MPSTHDTVFELRNYETRPGQRDALITLFEREFLDLQEELGARVVGAFRNLDDPDRFVWIRSFMNMETRAEALNAFYTHARWQSLRNEANATIVDNDNVLLLRPVWGRLVRESDERANAAHASIIIVTTHFVTPQTEVAFASFHAREVAPLLRHAGSDVLASFATEHAPNSYPRLPVRDDVVFVSVARFDDANAYETHLSTLATLSDWARVADETKRRVIAASETLRLSPTARSLLH